jgi:hypothetical protein
MAVIFYNIGPGGLDFNREHTHKHTTAFVY